MKIDMASARAITDSLESKKLISWDGKKYIINKIHSVVETLKCKKNHFEEIQEVFQVFLDCYFNQKSYENDEKTHFSFKKIWMNHEEKIILKSHFMNLNTFIKGLEEKYKKKGQQLGKKTIEKETIFWGDFSTEKIFGQILKQT